MENVSCSGGGSRELGRKSMSSLGSPILDHLMSTPVTNSKRVRKDDERVNPFERHLLNRLHESVWSPSVLNYTSSDEASMETPPRIMWAIDQIAKLNPIGIEESPSTHQNEAVLDAQSEARAQAAISLFFGTSEPIAPSPIRTPKSFNTKASNTDLSFPSILPQEFEQFLYSFSSSSSNFGNNEPAVAVVVASASTNGNGHHNQHPPTPSAELNTSLTRRKLDFTFEMDCGDEFDGSEDDEAHPEYLPINSIIMDMENSNGKTINSPP